MVGTKTIAAVLSVLALGGCATVPREAGFGDVQKAVAERSGHLVQWRGRTAEDSAVDQAVRTLLEKELTSEDAVEVALLNNLTLQATYQDLGIAQADLVQAGLLQNPVLSLERRFTGQAAEFDVAQDLISLLAMPLRKRVAGARFEVEKRRVGNAVLEIAAETRDAFYMLQAAEQTLEMRRSVAEATAASVDAAKRLHDAGNTNDLDLANERKLAGQARLDLAMAENEAVQARERLTTLMGVWGPATTWKISPRLPDPPASDPPQQGLETLAISRRLDLEAGRQEVIAAAQSLGLTQAFRYIPEITLFAHYSHETNPVHSIGPGVQFTVPLFDQGQAQVAKGQAMLQQAQLRYAAMAVEIRSKVRATYSQMIHARARAEYYRREVLPLQQQILDQTQLQFNGMFFGVFRLLEAKQAQINAGREYIEALRDYWVKRAELEKVTGGRLEGSAAGNLPGGPVPNMTSPEMNMKEMPGMKGMDMKGSGSKETDMQGMDHKSMPGMK
jgi:cobalt-zinc-cadmium efflux system outer membrane protein